MSLFGYHMAVQQITRDVVAFLCMTIALVGKTNRVRFIFITEVKYLFFRFPCSKELCPRVYCRVLENAIHFVRMCVAVSFFFLAVFAV